VSTLVTARRMQAPTPEALDVADVAILVADDGTIEAVAPAGSDAAHRLAAEAGPDARIVSTPPSSVLLPGMVDLHVHAPQWPQLGTGLDPPLEEWLFAYTFPLEARYADLGFARPVWADLVGGLLAHGTTTAVYFATVDLAATTALAEEALRAGQRAWVGRVAMDRPDGTPAWYRDADAAAGVETSRRSIEAVRALPGQSGPGARIRPIVTPRFSPACTDELLHGLGALAAATGTLVQAHASESDWAHRHPLERFGITDTAALDRAGLLRSGTILDHANHVTGADAALIAERGAGIAHCPLSNAYFANAVLPVRRLREQGVRIGLGTDVSGGASPSLLRTAHEAVTASRLLTDGVDPDLPPERRGRPGSSIDSVEAFWLATAGGAEVLGAPVGLLVPGRRFDAVLVDTRSRRGSLRVFDGLDSPERVFEKVVRLAGPSDIAGVWVDGVPVAGRAS
jgi:guanine deaminase